MCEQPANNLPSDTYVHRLLVSMLDIHVQAEPPLRACLQERLEHLRVATLPQLQASGTEGPTMVWHRTPPGDRYWEWVSQARHMVLTATAAWPRQPWIELRTERVAHFKYLARCLTTSGWGTPTRDPCMWPSTPRMRRHPCMAWGQPCRHTCGSVLKATQHCAPTAPRKRRPNIWGSGRNQAYASMNAAAGNHP